MKRSLMIAVLMALTTAMAQPPGRFEIIGSGLFLQSVFPEDGDNQSPEEIREIVKGRATSNALLQAKKICNSAAQITDVQIIKFHRRISFGYYMHQMSVRAQAECRP